MEGFHLLDLNISFCSSYFLKLIEKRFSNFICIFLVIGRYLVKKELLYLFLTVVYFMNLTTKSKCRVHTAFYHKLRFAYTFYLMVAVHSRRLFTFLPNFCTLLLLCIFVGTFFPLIFSCNALQNMILSTKTYKSFSVRTLRTKPDVDVTKYTVKHHTNIQAHENFRTKMLLQQKRTSYTMFSHFKFL